MSTVRRETPCSSSAGLKWDNYWGGGGAERAPTSKIETGFFFKLPKTKVAMQ